MTTETSLASPDNNISTKRITPVMAGTGAAVLSAAIGGVVAGPVAFVAAGKGAALVAAAGGATAGLAAESQWRRSSNTSPRSSLPLLGESLEDERGTTSTSQRDGDVNPVQTGGTKAQAASAEHDPDHPHDGDGTSSLVEGEGDAPTHGDERLMRFRFRGVESEGASTSTPAGGSSTLYRVGAATAAVPCALARGGVSGARAVASAVSCSGAALGSGVYTVASSVGSGVSYTATATASTAAVGVRGLASGVSYGVMGLASGVYAVGSGRAFAKSGEAPDGSPSKVAADGLGEVSSEQVEATRSEGEAENGTVCVADA
mmetsp:Transcript_21568/g.41136  ORF Transcript_21568/g.41136 Transcript_21568/m.41136 type:complete len:317 (+) Transcript_21568:234-1184(+)